MTMEYRISFQKGEWVVTQHLDPAGSRGVRVTSVETKGAKALEDSFDKSKAAASTRQPQGGGGEVGEDEAGPGSGSPGGTIVIFGPIVISGVTASAPAQGSGKVQPKQGGTTTTEAKPER